MKTLFLTGATGFVGSHAARLFLKSGWAVRTLVRRLDKPGLLPDGTTVIVGGLERPESYRKFLDGCDAVVHVAGLVKARTLAEYRAVNVHASGVIARAAAEVCPDAMFVHVSSQAAAGPSRDGRPLRESSAAAPVSWYGQSKWEGEQVVGQSIRGPWCVIRPSVVYGEGDPGMLELFKTIQSGWAPIVAGGKMRVQLIAVEDLARVLVAAAGRPDLNGRRLFAAGETVSMADLLGFIADLRSPPARCIPVPSVAVRTAGILESLRELITRRARPFNRDKAREMLQRDWLCDSEPTFRELGISDLRHWQDGIRAVCRCYVAASWLRSNAWAV